MLQNLRHLFVLMLVTGLCACSTSSPTLDGRSQLQARALFNPIDAQALGVKNLLSYDVYAEGRVLHALFAAETALPKQPYIGYLRSDDGGLHWTRPHEISQYSVEKVESGFGNDVQIAGHGNALVAIWQVTGEIPGMGPLQAMYSVDGGQTWALGENPTGSSADQSHPDLVVDQQRRFHLVWLDDRDENGYQGLRYARSSDAGLHWTLAQTLDESSCSCCWNRLLITNEDHVNALYRDMEPRDMALVQSADAGERWQRSGTVGKFNWVFDGCPHNGGALAGTQTLHSLVWTGAENKAGLYYTQSNDAAKTWSAPRVMGGGSLAFHSDIAAQDDKHVMAVWDAMSPEGSIVMLSESKDNGLHWSPARQISSPGSSANFPRIIASGSGFLAMWAEQKQGADKRWMSAILN